MGWVISLAALLLLIGAASLTPAVYSLAVVAATHASLGRDIADAGIEKRDVESGQLIGVLVGVFVLLAIVCFGLWLFYQSFKTACTHINNRRDGIED